MTGAVHPKPAGHGAAAVAAAAGKLNPFPNFCKERDRKVRFGAGGGGTSGDDDIIVTATEKQQQSQQQGMTMGERTLPTRLPGGVVIPKDQQTGELPTFGEHKVQQQAQKEVGADNEVQENRRLRGKLKWLFEQDRMYWESNSAKSSLRGSPKSHPSGGEATNDAKLVQGVEDSFKKMQASQKAPLDNRRPPRLPDNDRAKVSRVEASRVETSVPDQSANQAPTKVPWTFTNSTAKFWPRGKSKAGQDSKTIPAVENKTLVHVPTTVGQSCSCSVEQHHNRRLVSNESVTLMSSLDLGGEGFLLDHFEDGPKSGNTSDVASSDEDEEDEEMRRKVDGVINARGDRSLKDVKNQTAYLKVKCGMLAKEKDHAVRKWAKSCLEIDEAAQMAQALRTAIETLLEAGATDSRADFKARQDILEGQTEALKIRMEKLRRKNSEGLRRPSETKRSSKSLTDRIETLKKTSEGRSLASPEIPRDTEHKVEALRARLEKLMLATNSRVTEEQGQARRRARAQKRPAEDSIRHRPHPNEKGELKMKGWLNSLSAELTTEETLGHSTGVCEKCNGAHGGFLLGEIDNVVTPSASKQVTPATSKQVSPQHSAQERERDGPGSAPSSEETKKMVIHKIAEEVRLEAEQWFQVQELLGRVGEDMKSLQEACSTWERRAILAEAQVVSIQQEGQEKKERTQQVGDEKIAELQKEMLRLRETVDDVKKNLGSVSVDPSRWFEAAHNFGYAFMPVNLPHISCACKGKCNSGSCDKGTPDSSDHGKQKNTAPSGKTQPSSSANSTTPVSTISTSESMPADSEVKRRSQLPSQQWASEVAKAEEEEILTSTTATGELSKFEFTNNPVKEMLPGSGGKLQEKPVKLFLKEPGLESSGSRGDMLLQMQSSTRERYSILQQEEQLSRYANFIPASKRSPLRDVLENIASSKENKRPF